MENYSLLKEAHNLKLTPHKEPGRPLVIIGQLMRADKTPIAGQQIHFYQADHQGQFEEAITGDESTTRLSGSLTTDKKGRYRIKTVLPGASGKGPHIHLILPGAKVEDLDLYFKQYMSSEQIYWAKNETDEALVMRLFKDKKGRLAGIKDIVVE